MNDAKTFFYIYVTGQIDHCYFPVGPDGAQVFCKFDCVSGSDWELVSGIKSGITQSSTNRKESHEIAFNMPIEFTFKSTNTFGWPQVIISIYGKNFWGSETALGYARILVPLIGKHSISAPILIPKYSSFLSEFLSWFSGKKPELRNPHSLYSGLRGVQIESYGHVMLTLQTISQNINKMGYDFGSSDIVNS